jgi:O-antigen ligase
MTPRATDWIERLAWVLLCALVFSLPLEKAVMLPGVGTFARAIGALCLAAGTAAVVARRAIRIPNAGLLFAGCFVVWSGVTYFWSVSPPATAARFSTLAQLFLMLWLIWELCCSETRQSWLLRCYVYGAAVSSSLTVVRYLRNQQTYYRRYATAGFDPNDLGLTLALAIPMTLYLAPRVSKGWKWLVWLSGLLIVAAVLLTASRMALVACVVSFVYAAITWGDSPPAQRVFSAAMFAALVLGALWLAPSASRERLATLHTELASGTLHNRTHIWKAGLKVLKRHRLLGAGAGAYPEAVYPWLGRPGIPGHEYTAHNTFLSVLVETGFAGAALFGLLLATLAVFLWTLAPAERALWFTTFLVWAIGVSTLTWENRKPTWLLIALLLTAWARSFLPRERGPS